MASRASIPLLICLLGSAVAVAALSGIFDGDDPNPPAAAQVATDAAPADSSAAGTATITIENFAFGSDISVQPGQTVAVNNVDGAPHTVTATNGEFDTGTLGGGASGAFTAPSEPGTYSFFCQIHPSMTGTVTVNS